MYLTDRRHRNCSMAHAHSNYTQLHKMIAEYLFQFVTIACMDEVTLHASTPVVLNFYEIHKTNYIYYHFSILWRHGWLKLFFVEDPAGDNLLISHHSFGQQYCTEQRTTHYIKEWWPSFQTFCVLPGRFNYVIWGNKQPLSNRQCTNGFPS